MGLPQPQFSDRKGTPLGQDKDNLHLSFSVRSDDEKPGFSPRSYSSRKGNMGRASRKRKQERSPESEEYQGRKGHNPEYSPSTFTKDRDEGAKISPSKEFMIDKDSSYEVDNSDSRDSLKQSKIFKYSVQEDDDDNFQQSDFITFADRMQQLQIPAHLRHESEKSSSCPSETHSHMDN